MRSNEAGEKPNQTSNETALYTVGAMQCVSVKHTIKYILVM